MTQNSLFLWRAGVLFRVSASILPRNVVLRLRPRLRNLLPNRLYDFGGVYFRATTYTLNTTLSKPIHNSKYNGTVALDARRHALSPCQGAKFFQMS